MTKPACRPILSSAPHPFPDLRLCGSKPTFPETQEVNNSTGITMPALIGPSQSTLSDHCYGFRNTTSEPLATPKTIPVWKGLESSSNDCHLPSRHRSKYDRPDEHYSYSLGSPTARREGGSPWSEPDSCETSPPSFFPPSTDSYYQYSGPQAFGVGDSQWHAPDYASHLDDYPTPQSNLSLSPPQQARGHIGRSGRYVAPSGSTTVKQEFGDIPPFGIPFPQPLGVPSLGQPGSPYQHDVGKQESLDECDDSDEDGSAHGEPPYAQLIFRALRSAPGHAMVLKDIYRWFEKNTDKAKKGSTGWQNSIRHNLSMNGVRLFSA